MSDDDLLVRATRDLLAQEAQGARVAMDLSLQEAWLLLGALQLALRHPGWSSPSRTVVDRLVRLMAGEVSRTPALRELAARGFDAKFDVAKK